MNKHSLSKDQITTLIGENAYEISNRLLSRCIDGRYENDTTLPGLAFPGADAGEFALVCATAATCGLEIELKKTFDALVEVVGGVKNLRFHTDSHAEQGKVLAGCGHIKQIVSDLETYNVTKEQSEFITEQFSLAKKAGAKESVLQGDHKEAAVLFIKGDYGVLPQFRFESREGGMEVQIFIYHNTLVDARHRLFVKKLIEHKALTLEGKPLDEEHLYALLSEAAEVHLMETAGRLAKGLPIYEVTFSGSKNAFEVAELGNVG